MKKRIIALAAVMLMSAAASALPADIGSQIGASVSVSAADVKINATEVKLYCLSDTFKEKISIPASFPEQFQLKVTGAKNVYYYREEGRSADVSSDGLITPHCTTYYWYGSMGYSWKLDGKEPDRITKEYSPGESRIRINADGQYYYVTVTVEDYAAAYVDRKIDEYIKQNVTDSMTDKEKIQQACKMAASYDYDAHYSGANSMVIMGGGDCWASTDLIVRFCQKLGMNAWWRNGNKDPGAGSGHMNAMVCANGKYYEAEAGYVGTAPRSYYVTERTSLYSYRTVTGGIEVYQYDGETVPEVLEIPAAIDGKKVVSIGAKFITVNDDLKKVIIPEGVTKISDQAFGRDEYLEEVVIPSTVQTIGDYVFSACFKLTKITVASGNQYFSAKDGVLYNKDKTTLLYCPAASQVTIPGTVKTIAGYAFYYNYELSEIVIPDSVTSLGEGAFGECEILEDVTIGKNVASVGNYAFCGCYKLTALEVPASVTTIGNAGFGYSSPSYRMNDFTLYVSKDSAALTFAVDNEINYVIGSKPRKGTLSGKLTLHSASGTMTGVTLTAVDGTGESFTLTPEADGTYSGKLVEGKYTVTAAKDGCVTASGTVTVIGDGQSTLDLDLWLFGDVNKDSKVNMRDYALLQKHLLDNSVKVFKTTADMDGNGKLNMRDYALLQKLLLG